jgi:hypothetical protein
MNIASIIGNCGGSFKALAQGVYSWCSFAGIVAALGHYNIAAIAQPLPDRGGFYDGGYTGSGPERNSWSRAL